MTPEFLKNEIERAEEAELAPQVVEFYRSIFIPGLLLVLAVFKKGLKRAPVHYFFGNIEDFLNATFSWDAKGVNVYHGCAGYRTNQNRRGENSGGAFCIWIDLDVGPNKPYASKQAALAAYERFRITLGLPLSHVVDSGNGIHIYQPLAKPITPDQWKRLVALFAQCLDHFGVKHDTSRTGDIASILRIPGTHNHKTDTPKPVKLKRIGVAAPAPEVWKLLKAYADTHDLTVGPIKPKGVPKATNDLIGNRNYPPSYAENILPRCAVLREVADTGGDVPYEIWWRAMGVAKFLHDCEAVAVHWTRNRANTGHEQTDHEKAMKSWTGPTTCGEFSKHSSKCVTCNSLRRVL